MNYKKRVFYLASGVVSMLFAGIIYAWSILKMPLEEAFGWSPPQMALNFTLTMCFFCIGGLVSGLLLRQGKSPKAITLIAALLSALGFLLSSRLAGQIIHLYLCYGLMCGLGIGMAYNVIIASTGAWFPDKKGTCSGVLMMGFGASALVLRGLLGFMIDSVSLGWRQTYVVLGTAMGIILLLESLIIRFPPRDMEIPKPGQAKKESAGSEIIPRDFTTAEMIKRSSFWRFFLFSISIAAVGITVISFAKDLSLSVGASGALATTLVGVLSVCNGVGRILCGVIFDAAGRRKTMLLASALTIAAISLGMLAITTGSLTVCVLGLCVTGLAYGCGPTISSAFVSSFYGTKNFAMNFSAGNSMLIPASFVATLSAGLASSTGSYAASFFTLFFIALIGLGLNLSLKQP